MSLLSLFTVLICFNHSAFAEPPRSPIRAATSDPSFVTDEMKKNAQITLETTPPTFGVTKKARDLVFKNAGLTQILQDKKIDEMDQDILYQSLKSNELAKTIAEFPMIPSEKLKAAKALIQGAK
jgi:hypothetical protein